MGDISSATSLNLPPIEVLDSMDAIEREVMLSRVLATIKRKKMSAIEKSLALPDIAEWIEANCYDADKVRNAEFPQGSPKIVLEDFQRRILRHCFTINPVTGRFPYRTIVYSAPKKSGKSAIGGCITAYFAANVEIPNAIYVLANDREQSSGRVYKAAKPTLYGLNAKRDGKYVLYLPNGSYVVASTSNPDKEAGGSYGLTVWDELWAFTTERSNLLWDELRPVPTRVNSMRVVVTYAGFEDSSDLLYKLYKVIFVDSSETELTEGARPVAGLEDISTTNANGDIIPTCYEHPESGLFYFNDHEQRMKWQIGEHGAALIREITATESKETNTYRLTHNRWQKTEDRFITDEELRASFSSSAICLPRQTKPMTIAVDGGWRKDASAVIGVSRHLTASDDRYSTDFAKVWYPKTDPNSDGIGLDLRATIFQTVLDLVRAGLVARREPLSYEKSIILTERCVAYDIWYDETQLHQVFVDLRKEHKILAAKFDQKKPRILADTFLRNMYQTFKIDNLDDKDLYSHLNASRALAQTDADHELFRIVKGTGEHAKPIDMTVAQSMAVYRCSLRPVNIRLAGIAQGKAKGWQAR